jgi:hypothetical protein
MCGDYHLMNKWTRSKKYAMPLLEEIFDALGQAKVFNTFGLEVVLPLIAIKGR